MSLYLAPSGIDAARLHAVATEFDYPGKVATVGPGAAGFLWVDDTPERFAPATDSATGVRVVSSGRLAWSPQEWSRAKRLPYQGGLANRLILDRYMQGGADAITPYNGAAVVTLYDPRTKVVHVWTDQFGYHPCYIYRGDRADQCIITTFPDALLADPLIDLTFDTVSMAEFLRAWRTTPPHTYFTEVKCAGAAMHISIDVQTGRITHREYWKPFEDAFFPSKEAATEELAAAIKTAINERTSIARRPLLFLSGGADSRVVLFCAANRSAVTGVNLYERESSETVVARQLCESAGAKFVALQRDTDFYPRQLAENVRWSGAMWSAEDSHYLGFAGRTAEFQPDLVMTGCTTDWVFKGYGLEKKYVSILGRNLPVFAYTNERVDGFLPNIPGPAPAHLAAAVNDRMSDWFAGCPRVLASPRDRLVVEDRRIRPTAYTVSVSGSMMYRTFPYDTFLADSRVAACYSRIHPDWKLNRELWGRIAARLCAEGGQIVDANYGWRVNASLPEKLSAFASGWVTRRMRSSAMTAGEDGRPASSGSWPDLGWYATNSPTLNRIWHSSSPEERDRMREICTTDPWQVPLAEWANDGPHLFRLLTLLCFWRETERRRGRGRLPPTGFHLREPSTAQ